MKYFLKKKLIGLVKLPYLIIPNARGLDSLIAAGGNLN